MTALGTDGRPRGLTLSAFCAVSSRPPLVLVCVDRESNTLEAVKDAGAFTVNVLSSGSRALARRYATKNDEKFDGVVWEAPSLAGAGPILRQHCAAYAVCGLRDCIEAGDHFVLIGEVVEGEAWADIQPLVYSRRAFGVWAD